MEKLYRAYANNKVIFFILYFIYNCFLSWLAFELFIDYLFSSMPSFGDPRRVVELSLLSNLAYIGVLIFVGCMIIIPFVGLTIKSIKNKKLQILCLWGCAVIACILGILLCMNGVRLFGKIPEMLGDMLLSFT